jgi:uncharacterized protein YbbC (DUF1343 family)
LRFYFLFFCLLSIVPTLISQTLTGADVLIRSDFTMLHGKSVGLITNNSAINQSNQSLVQALSLHPKVNLVGLFSPEHGFLVNKAAGVKITSQKFDTHDIPVYSLYGQHLAPSKSMLANIDILLFDIQDIGTRFYTYISTLALSLKAASENGIQYIVLDRPNPISGFGCDGPIMAKHLFSFIGIAPIPIMHGLTIGEFAEMLVGENWADLANPAQLDVIKMENWHHRMFWESAGLVWIPPSPNIPSVETALVYPGMGLLEATNISEGRGTPGPFTIVGSPWLNNNYIIDNLKIPGIQLEGLRFTPIDIIGKAINPKFKNQLCNGLKLKIKNRDIFKPVEFAIHLICFIRDFHPDLFKMNLSRMEKMLGSFELAKMIETGKGAEIVIKSYQQELEAFKIIRKKYLLYSE